MRSTADAVLALVVLAASVLLMVHVVTVTGGAPLARVDAYTWPFVALLLMGGCAAVLLVSALLAPRRAVTDTTAAAATSADEGPGDPDHPAPRPFKERFGPVLLIAMTTLFIWSLPVIGFAVATVAWFPLAVALLGYVKPRVIVLSSVVFYLFTYGIFVAWLGLSLPRGTGVFSQISRAIGI